MREDDQELLDFAMQWLRFSLFQEKTSEDPSRSSRPTREPPKVLPGPTP